MGSRQKDAISRSFRNAQKSFTKCNILNEVSKVGWSACDSDLNATITSGVGGAHHTFRNAANLYTNDALLYKDNRFNNKTSRDSNSVSHPNGPYYYHDPENKMQRAKLDFTN